MGVRADSSLKSSDFPASGGDRRRVIEDWGMYPEAPLSCSPLKFSKKIWGGLGNDGLTAHRKDRSQAVEGFSVQLLREIRGWGVARPRNSSKNCNRPETQAIKKINAGIPNPSPKPRPTANATPGLSTGAPGSVLEDTVREGHEPGPEVLTFQIEEDRGSGCMERVVSGQVCESVVWVE